jgi:hypothetical protein
MTVRKLFDAGIGALAGVAGSKKAAKEVNALKGLFDGAAYGSVDDALSELRSILESEKTVVQRRYMKRLLDAGTDEVAFNTVFRDLEKEKHLDKPAVSAIAQGYTEERKEWPNAKAALRAIRNAFDQRASQDGKLRIISK